MKTSVTIILIITILLSCSTKSISTLDSDACSDKSERIEQLENNIKLFSPIVDAEFELFDVNGFEDEGTSFPGASSWDYKFAIKVSPENINKWIDDMNKIDSLSADSWTTQIIEKRKQNWIVTSQPEFYKRKNDNVVLIVYRKEAIIFKRILNL